MEESRAATPGRLWANTSVQCPDALFPVLTLLQKAHTELAFKGMLAEKENVGAFIAEKPKRRLLGRIREASAKTRGEAPQPLSSWSSR